jgi:hypothetical protein
LNNEGCRFKNSEKAIFFLVCFATSCSFLSDKPKPRGVSLKKNELTKVNTKNNVPDFDSVRISWKVPNKGIDGYVIKYGYKPDMLSEKVVIQKEQLILEKTKENGAVYSYFLSNVNPKKNLYFKLHAFTGKVNSPNTVVYATMPVD